MHLSEVLFLKEMDGGGFEPPKQFAADLQSVPFGHSGSHPYRADERTRTVNLLITNQLLCQLSHIGLFRKSGAYRARTYDPLLVRQMLSQLSYDPSLTNYVFNDPKGTRTPDLRRDRAAF